MAHSTWHIQFTSRTTIVFLIIYFVSAIFFIDNVTAQIEKQPWYEALPAVAMDYKVHLPAGKEDCYYQYVQPGATLYVSFQVIQLHCVLLFATRLVYVCMTTTSRAMWALLVVIIVHSHISNNHIANTYMTFELGKSKGNCRECLSSIWVICSGVWFASYFKLCDGCWFTAKRCAHKINLITFVFMCLCIFN